MTKQLNPSQLSEDYISVHLPFKGRSASQVLQDDTTLNSVKLWGKRSCLRCRLRCVYCCLDLAHGLKTIGRSTKVSDSTKGNANIPKIRTGSQKWMVWKRLFSFKHKNNDIMTKKEAAENGQNLRQRRNAAVFIPDYEEEQTVYKKNNRKYSIELCDLEDSGHYDMNEDK